MKPHGPAYGMGAESENQCLIIILSTGTTQIYLNNSHAGGCYPAIMLTVACSKMSLARELHISVKGFEEISFPRYTVLHLTDFKHI